MVKKKKKDRIKNILIACFFILTILFFSKPIISFSANSFIRSYTKRVFGEKIFFKSFKMKNKKIILKDVSISSPKYIATVDEINIDLNFKFFKPKVIADINMKKPKICFLKFEIPKKFKVKKLGFFTTKVNVEDGVLSFLDKSFYFDITQSNINSLTATIEMSNQKKMYCDVNTIQNKTCIRANLDEIEIAD